MSAVDRIFLARDVYGVWKRRVSRAQASIRVFTPYFDKLLDRLLSNATIAPERISVVTDLSPESGALNYRRQLVAALVLLDHGIEIRSLPRLHAKVLLCDGKTAVVGSQNFTSYARGSNETTVANATDVGGSTFLETLEDWYASAAPLTAEFIDTLLNHLEAPIEEIAQAHQTLSHAFEEEWRIYLDEREALRRAAEAAEARRALPVRLAVAFSNATERQAREAVWARLEDSGGWNGFRTLRADRGATFTEWLGRDSSGARTRVVLERFHLHPVIVSTTGRMGFARVAGQQISYVRFSIDWNRPCEILGQRYRMAVRYPESDLATSNIEMTLTLAGQPEFVKLELRILFDGTDARLSGSEVKSTVGAGSMAAGQRETLQSLALALGDVDSMGNVIATTFKPFKYEVLGIDNPNAADFFPSGWVKTTLIDFRGTHVLVVAPQ